MDISKNFEFIQELFELYHKYGLIVAYCEECDCHHPWESDDDDIMCMETEIIDWFVDQREKTALEN
jgi:hypothetical protein